MIRRHGTVKLPPADSRQIPRYWDAREGLMVARIQPGHFYVTGEDEIISTILGSCVSACIRDPERQLGGINHFMLPFGRSDGPDPWRDAPHHSESARYGNFAMEQLINELLRQGARRDSLEVKIVGGGQMWKSSTDVGGQNIAFVLDYLRAEGLSISAEDVGGRSPRQVQYFPLTGRLRVRKLRPTDVQDAVAAEARYRRRIVSAPVAGEVELF